MASGKDGKDGAPAKIAKAAGVAVAAGAVTWSIVGFLKGKKEAEYAVDVDAFEDLVDNVNAAEAAEDESLVNKEIDVLYVQREVIAAVVDIPKPERKIESEEDLKFASPAQEIEPSKEKKPWFHFLLETIQKGIDKSKAWKGVEDGKAKSKPGSDPPASKSGLKETYEIKKGDTLWAISGKYGLPLDSLKAANGLHGDKIYAGDKLIIPDV